MVESKILFSRENFIFIKNDKNNYSLSFNVKNNNIDLTKLIHFNITKIIYELNVDIYEKYNLNIINENEANVNILIKHLFEDLGLPQYYIYLHITKYVEENNIIFFFESIKSEILSKAELLNITNSTIMCDIITPHNINFECNFLLDNINIPEIEIVEKLIGIILYKIFKRLKQFIEIIKI
jgi:hypothetical protein